jgi:SAM-dependent methyltransferase
VNDERRDADEAFRQQQLALFRSSVLKQAKWKQLARAAGDPAGLDALDLGSDNGVISYLFRQRGGRWTSADLTPETVDAIRRMVGDRVHLLSGPALPFPNESFDLIVVVDLLEHLSDDGRLLSEIARCLRPGGRAVLNVPHAKRLALLEPVRRSLGLTDEWHGHVHHGYSARMLRGMLPAELSLSSVSSYSRFFSHALDTALNWTFLRKSRGRARSTAKGMVVMGDGVGAGGAKLMRRVYPAMRMFAAADTLIPWSSGYMLLATLKKQPATSTPRSGTS